MSCTKCEDGWVWVEQFDDGSLWEGQSEEKSYLIKSPCQICRPPKAIGYTKPLKDKIKELEEKLANVVQVWEKEGVVMVLRPQPNADYYLEYREGCFWISGWSYYKLISEGWERI